MIDRIVEQIETANNAYRTGNAIITDREYDNLLELLRLYDPEHPLLTKVGIEIVDEERKAKLPIEMGSMNKIKTMEEIYDWFRLKGIPRNTDLVITPKLDGLSLCKDEETSEAFTRGDGEYGQKSDEHNKLINNQFKFKSSTPFKYTYGEVVMSKKIFEEKYTEFANTRNLVAGLLNSKEVSESLKDCDYIKYGAIPQPGIKYVTKSDILKSLNNGQDIKIDYEVSNLSLLTEEYLIDLFHKWSENYVIDGLIIEVNDLSLQERLGRETSSNNPCYARAFKHDSFEERAESTIIGLTYNISKQGLLKPVLHIEPIKLDGVTVSNVTGNNAKFIKDMGLGIGAKVVVKRSGMVIPLIVEVLETVEFVMPTVEGTEIDWNESGIELITLTETNEQKLKKNIAFFEILEADNVSEGIITQLWDAGYQTIEQILNIKQTDLEKIDRFGKRKAQIVFNSIQKSITNVPLHKLQHATGLFKGLGSKKLALLDFTEKPTLEQIMDIDGFAEISAKSYLDNYDDFFTFIKDLPITIAKKVETVAVGTDLESKSFVFTGVRRKDLEEIIVSRGGKIGSSVSKNTTYLVMKEKGSGSSKETKALSMGVTILNVTELEKLLND